MRVRALRMRMFVVLAVLAAADLLVVAKPSPSETPPHEPPFWVRSMDGELLVNPSGRRLLIEVDSFSECKPREAAWRGLVQALESVLPGRQIDVFLDDHPPQKDRPQTSSEIELDELAQQWLDTTPDETTDVIYVAYLPRLSGHEGGVAGARRPWVVRRQGAFVYVPGFTVSCSLVEHGMTRLVSRRRLERHILTHEMGHVLGLTTNPRHTLAGDPLHCTEHRCVMSVLGSRSLFSVVTVGLPWSRLSMRFGKRCHADIATHRAWVDGAPDADERFRRATSYRSAAALGKIAGWHRRRGDDEAAFKVAADAAERFPENPGLQSLYASYLELRGQTDAAIRSYEKAVAARADDKSRRRLAKLLCGRARYDTALDVLEPMRANPGFFDIPLLAWALEGAGRTPEAGEFLDKMTHDKGLSRGQRSMTRLALVGLLRRMGNLTEARRELDEIYLGAWTPDLLEAARLTVAMGEKDEAGILLARIEEQGLANLREAEAEGNAFGMLDAALNLLDGYSMHADRQSAMGMMKRVEAIAEKHPSFAKQCAAKYRVAAALARLGDESAAIAELRAAGKMYPPEGPGTDPCLADPFKSLRASASAGSPFLYCLSSDPAVAGMDENQ